VVKEPSSSHFILVKTADIADQDSKGSQGDYRSVDAKTPNNQNQNMNKSYYSNTSNYQARSRGSPATLQAGQQLKNAM